MSDDTECESSEENEKVGVKKVSIQEEKNAEEPIAKGTQLSVSSDRLKKDEQILKKTEEEINQHKIDNKIPNLHPIAKTYDVNIIDKSQTDASSSNSDNVEPSGEKYAKLNNDLKKEVQMRYREFHRQIINERQKERRKQEQNDKPSELPSSDTNVPNEDIMPQCYLDNVVETTDGNMEESVMDEVMVKCEIIEISDEELNFDIQPKKKRVRVKKKPDPANRVKCEQCTKTFDSRYQMKKHLRTHTGERPYMCTVCGKTYTQLGHLSIHLMKHNGVKNFNCTQCPSSFYRKADLDRHEKIHSGIKPHTCQICNKSFVQKTNLVMHVKMHVGDRQFECDVCLKKFITRSKLNQHYKRHLKDKKKKQIVVYGDSADLTDEEVLGS